MRSVVIVQHEPSVPAGCIRDVLVEDGIEHRVIEAWHESTWPEPADMGAVVVMGGTMNVDELDRYPFLARSRHLMADALDHDIPTLGVCLGSQMMARVLGAEVYRAPRRTATFSGLKLTDEGADDRVLAPFATGLPVLQFHEDTLDIPEDAVALATSDSSGLSQAFRYGTSAYAIQFHFEVDDAILNGWTRAIGSDAMRDQWGITEEALASQASGHLAAQTAAGKQLVRNFLAVVL